MREISKLTNTLVSNGIFNQAQFVFYSADGAMGVPGTLIIVTDEGSIYEGNYVFGDLSIKKAIKEFPYIGENGIQNHLFLHINQVNKKQPPRSRNSSQVALFGFIWVAGALSSTLLSVLGEFLLPRRSDEVVDIVSGNIIKIIRTASAIITKQNYLRSKSMQ